MSGTNTFIPSPPPPCQLITAQVEQQTLPAQQRDRQQAIQHPQQRPDVFPDCLRGKASSADQSGIDQLLRRLMALGGGCDLAFVVFALQIQSTNKLISEQIKGVQQLAALRDNISASLDTIRTMKACAAADKDGKLKPTEMAQKLGSEGAIDDATPGRNGDIAYYQTIWTLDPKTNEPVSEQGKALFETKKAGLHKGNYRPAHLVFTKDRLEAEEGRLQAQLEKIDSDREIAMITLNANINRKGQFVEWLSNIMKRTGDTQSSVINNLR